MSIHEMKWSYRRLELNGGRVDSGPPLVLRLPVVNKGYADAQIDDYGGKRRSDYLWRPCTLLRLKARFSHRAGELMGTAGFGFWNAPMSEPTILLPALPQVTWFFYASAPSDLPLPLIGPGRGWFVSTLDASTYKALMIAPLAVPVVLLNNVNRFRTSLWPGVRHRLQISFSQVEVDMTEWHDYQLLWGLDGCVFTVDGGTLFETRHSPKGPLGFVCWIDNRYMIARPTGRFQWGVVAAREEQWLEVDDLQISRF